MRAALSLHGVLRNCPQITHSVVFLESRTTTQWPHLFVELLLIHAMPHCPRCGRSFKTDEKVTHHLNQPRSSCVTLDTSDLISIPLPPNTLQFQNILKQELFDVDMNVAPDDDSNFATQGDADIQMAIDNTGSFNSVTGSTHREEFPNAAHECGAGETFMGKFDLDDFSDQRKKNLYYPFASREEWEVAAFLLRSGMSMALVDDFLNLQTVSNSLFSLEICYLLCLRGRFALCTSHFKQQRT